MAKNILITGGAKSGKSRWAVTHFAMYDYVLYLKTSEAVDADTLNRIEYGNKKNFVEWDIVTNGFENPAEKIGDHKFVIFDSLSDTAAEPPYWLSFGQGVAGGEDAAKFVPLFLAQ